MLNFVGSCVLLLFVADVKYLDFAILDFLLISVICGRWFDNLI